MPKVIGYTPPWLSRPSAGAKVFLDPAPQSPASPSKRSSYLGAPPSTEYQGPRRLVASRGTEIFTVVGNKIRWADLSLVKDEWEENTHAGNSQFGLSRSADAASEQQVYRVCPKGGVLVMRLTMSDPGCVYLLPNSTDCRLSVRHFSRYRYRTHRSYRSATAVL